MGNLLDGKGLTKSKMSLLTYSTDYYQQITLESWFTNLEQTALNRSQARPTPFKFTQQETVTRCLLFILQPIYLHKLSPHTSSQPIMIT